MYDASSCGYLQSQCPAGAGAGVRCLIPGFRVVYSAIKSSDVISARRRLCRGRQGCLQGYVPVSRSPTPYDALQAGEMPGSAGALPRRFDSTNFRALRISNASYAGAP